MHNVVKRLDVSERKYVRMEKKSWRLGVIVAHVTPATWEANRKITTNWRPAWFQRELWATEGCVETLSLKQQQQNEMKMKL